MTTPTHGPPDGAHPHVLVADVAAPTPDDAAAHHLRRVLRLRLGDRVTVTDGAGRWRWCRLDGAATLEADGPVATVPRPTPPITVAMAITKGDKPELAAQKLTEIGVDRLIWFPAERSVVRWDDAKRARVLERLHAITRGAVEQSGRCWTPSVEIADSTAAVAAMRAVRLDRGHGTLSRAHSVVAIGPEGGWSDTERELFSETAQIGPHVLRSETAAITSCALMVSMRSGFISSATPGGGGR